MRQETPGGRVGDEPCCKGGQRVLGDGGGAERGSGCLRLGWHPTGFLSAGDGEGVSLPRQLYESNKWVHTFIPEFDGAFRLGFRRPTKVSHDLADPGLRNKSRVRPRVSVLDLAITANGLSAITLLWHQNHG